MLWKMPAIRTQIKDLWLIVKCKTVILWKFQSADNVTDYLNTLCLLFFIKFLLLISCLPSLIIPGCTNMLAGLFVDFPVFLCGVANPHPFNCQLCNGPKMSLAFFTLHLSKWKMSFKLSHKRYFFKEGGESSYAVAQVIDFDEHGMNIEKDLLLIVQQSFKYSFISIHMFSSQCIYFLQSMHLFFNEGLRLKKTVIIWINRVLAGFLHIQSLWSKHLSSNWGLSFYLRAWSKHCQTAKQCLCFLCSKLHWAV